MKSSNIIIAIVLLFQSSIALTQDSVQVWIGPNGTVGMTQEKAAQLINAEDSLQILYIENKLITNALQDCNLLTNVSEEVLNNLLEQKVELEGKIKTLQNRLGLKADKIMLYMDEVEECDIMLQKANTKLKRQKTMTTVTTVIGSSALVAVIVTILIIVL